MSNIKGTVVIQDCMTWYKLDGRHVARRRRRWAHAPVIQAGSYFTMRKELHGLPFLCMHAILFL